MKKTPDVDSKFIDENATNDLLNPDNNNPDGLACISLMKSIMNQLFRQNDATEDMALHGNGGGNQTDNISINNPTYNTINYTINYTINQATIFPLGGVGGSSSLFAKRRRSF